jgi:hypothetical protein
MSTEIKVGEMRKMQFEEEKGMAAQKRENLPNDLPLSPDRGEVDPKGAELDRDRREGNKEFEDQIR